MKLVIYILIIFITTYIGYLYNRRYENRYIFYKSYNNFIIKFATNISFSNEKLEDFLQKNSSTINSSILKIKKTNERIKLSFLNDIENNDFNDFILCLGKGDSDSQISLLKSKEKEVFEKMNETKLENEKYKNLYVKLGFLIGLIIVISIL